MFKRNHIAIDETALQKIINGALRFLQKRVDFCAEITLMQYEHTKRPVEIMDLFDVFHSDVYSILSDDDPMDLPDIDYDCSKVENAQIQEYSYIFVGDLDTRFHLAPVVYQGKKGIMLHNLECYKIFPKDESSYRGFVQAEFIAFEEDGNSELGLHYLWSLIDRTYQKDDDDFYRSLSDLTGCW